MISIYRLFHPFGCPSVTAGVGGEGWERGLDLKDSTGEEASTIEEVIEPYLIRQGLLESTPRGRVASAEAYSHLET